MMPNFNDDEWLEWLNEVTDGPPFTASFDAPDDACAKWVAIMAQIRNPGTPERCALNLFVEQGPTLEDVVVAIKHRWEAWRDADN